MPAARPLIADIDSDLNFDQVKRSARTRVHTGQRAAILKLHFHECDRSDKKELLRAAPSSIPVTSLNIFIQFWFHYYILSRKLSSSFNFEFDASVKLKPQAYPQIKVISFSPSNLNVKKKVLIAYWRDIGDIKQNKK